MLNMFEHFLHRGKSISNFFSHLKSKVHMHFRQSDRQSMI